MGVIVTVSTLLGCKTPICSACGIKLCWDISQEEYQEHPEFWDAWECKDCSPEFVRIWIANQLKERRKK